MFFKKQTCQWSSRQQINIFVLYKLYLLSPCNFSPLVTSLPPRTSSLHVPPKNHMLQMLKQEFVIYKLLGQGNAYNYEWPLLTCRPERLFLLLGVIMINQQEHLGNDTRFCLKLYCHWFFQIVFSLTILSEIGPLKKISLWPSKTTLLSGVFSVVHASISCAQNGDKTEAVRIFVEFKSEVD